MVYLDSESAPSGGVSQEGVEEQALVVKPVSAVVSKVQPYVECMGTRSLQIGVDTLAYPGMSRPWG